MFCFVIPLFCIVLLLCRIIIRNSTNNNSYEAVSLEVSQINQRQFYPKKSVVLRFCASIQRLEFGGPGFTGLQGLKVRRSELLLNLNPLIQDRKLSILLKKLYLICILTWCISTYAQNNKPVKI